MDEIKKNFPIFTSNPDVVYLDSAASAQKPQSVIDAMNDFYCNSYANIHRGLYNWSENASMLYDDVRAKVAKFIGASDMSEIVFTKGSTEAFNLLASSYRSLLIDGDEIIVSEAEHHSNFLPWKDLELQKNIKIKYLPILEDGSFDYDWFEKNISDKVKLVCVTAQSNVIGLKNNIGKIVKISHNYGAKVCVDGAQLTAHDKVNVSVLDIDFYVFSSHKIYGPTGLGILYGKKSLLDLLPPYQFGGDMVESVSLDKVVFKEPPSKFEAGTPPVVEVVGLGAAIDFIESIGMDKISKYLAGLTTYLIAKLSEISGVKFISSMDSNSIVSFVIDSVSSFDIGFLLGKNNICVRVGKHCAEPLHTRFGIDSSIRVSLGIYNDKEDIDKFIETLKKVLVMLR